MHPSGLGTHDDEASDSQPGEHGLEGRVLERVAVALLDDEKCGVRPVRERRHGLHP